ncbi:MAG: NADH:flavin oxidoreductase/NADH oxidase [Methylococcaceae bacterium]|nr:NADH:flavin oxidoreductase/NADH oxidase [Methylococcaceae bacterium]
MSQLFTPFSIDQLMLKNRIVIAPMCQYSAHEGQASDWHLIHLGHLAMSGAGLLIIEATAVEPEGRISPTDLGLWSDATETALRAVLASVRKYSTMPMSIQLAHAGRKASTAVPWEGGHFLTPAHGGWQTIAPSAIPFAPQDTSPKALENADLQRILQAFVSAAQRAYRLGLDAIEIHSAHGYLLHEFLSPLSNTRTDQYGGSLENRLRYPLQIFEAVRAAVPETFPVGIRISATDWVEGGWDLAQSVVFSQALRERGCSFIHVSSGGLSMNQQIQVGPCYQVDLAETIRKESALPTIAVGLITKPAEAESIIAEGKADMVALARGILYNPRWPWHAAAELGAQVEAPAQYWRCQPAGLTTLFGKN